MMGTTRFDLRLEDLTRVGLEGQLGLQPRLDQSAITFCGNVAMNVAFSLGTNTIGAVSGRGVAI